MFKKLALSLVLSFALLSSSNAECGPISAFVGYWTTKAVVYVAAVATVIVAPGSTVVINPATTAAVAETSSTAVASLLAVLPLP